MATEASGSNPTVIWQPQSGPQEALIDCPVFEVFFGGARGGGKTDGMLGEWAVHADQYGENASGLMVRRTREELSDTIERSYRIYSPIGATYQEQKKQWRFPNGARLRFAYLERDSDAENYQGHSYTRVYVEEIGNFPQEAPVLKLMATLRSAEGVPVGFRATGNPGGVGHAWVKERYISPAPAGWKVLSYSFDNPFTGDRITRNRIYIPSRLDDNPILLQNDPGYVANLQMQANPDLVKAWLEGDWDVVAGAALDISKNRHMLRTFKPPAHWTKFQVMDWGYVRPYSIGWYCVVEGVTKLSAKGSWEEQWLPDGAVIRYRELYGWNGKSNEGARHESPDVVRMILRTEDEAEEKIDYRVADTQIWAKNDGTSIFERMFHASKDEAGHVRFNPMQSEKDRQASYSEICTRLKGELMEDGQYVPMFYATENCTHFWRTVPSLILDDLHPERGPDEGQENHVYDELQYALMSRPYIRTEAQRIKTEFFRKRWQNNMERGDPYRLKPGKR